MAKMRRKKTVKRTASLKITPPNKKTKAGMKEENTDRELNIKDLEISMCWFVHSVQMCPQTP